MITKNDMELIQRMFFKETNRVLIFSSVKDSEEWLISEKQTYQKMWDKINERCKK